MESSAGSQINADLSADPKRTPGEIYLILDNTDKGFFSFATADATVYKKHLLDPCHA